MKKVLVIGAALSGTRVSQLLAKKRYDVTLTDSKKIDNRLELEEMGIHVYDGGHPDFLKEENWEFIVKNPGIPYHVPFVNYFYEKKVPIYNEIEVAYRYAKNMRFATITGTNGKTTTTTLLGELLKRKNPKSFSAGNIGVPLSEIVMENEELDCDVALEIAAFQLLGCPTLHPRVSVCMNLTPDHLDYFKSLNKYYDAKMLVYQNQRDDDWFLLNIDDAEIVKRAVNVPCQIVSFSLEKKADLCIKEGWVSLFDRPLFKVEDLHLPGKHNLQNAMVASAMAYKMGVSVEDIQDCIFHFKGVEHRIEFVREYKGVKYYNDSKGTNVDATIVALKAFEKPVILLAGGYDKKTGFEGLKPYLNRIKTMIVYGETKYQLKELMPEAIVKDTMEEAVSLASEIAKENDIVLLSPVCASWDQFKSYEERGELFKKQVNELK